MLTVKSDTIQQGKNSPVNFDQDNMKYESNRLASLIKHGWPEQAKDGYHVGARDLAKSGFYPRGRENEVHCAFCRLMMTSWDEGDDVEAEHRKFNEKCPLLSGVYVGNVLLGQEDQRENLACDSIVKSQMVQVTAADGASSLGLSLPLPVEEFMDPRVRERSFVNAPAHLITHSRTPRLFSDAGFFYMPGNKRDGDIVQCFRCRVALYKWDIDDDPFYEHAKWSPNCMMLHTSHATNAAHLREQDLQRSSGTRRFNSDLQVEEIADEAADVEMMSTTGMQVEEEHGIDISRLEEMEPDPPNDLLGPPPC